ncbi:MAG: monovalent cation/H(+) antiporter subunit G, partial [candidate division WOR-3 bacterium]
MIETIGWIIIVIGVFFDLLGSLGLVRFPDLYNRMQAATKCVTLGTCGIMVGIFLITGFSSMGIKALICALFILFTMPVAAHALSRSSLISGIKMWKGTVIDKLGEDKGKEQIEKDEKA